MVPRMYSMRKVIAISYIHISLQNTRQELKWCFNSLSFIQHNSTDPQIITQKPMKALKEAFKIFDKNKNGFIEAKELKTVTTTLGEKLTDEEFGEFWKEADVNSDGKLDYNEFVKAMTKYWIVTWSN